MINKKKIKIGVLHSAIFNGGNAGDSLICKRGRDLLGKFLGDDFEFTYIRPYKPFYGDFDGYIILGGPVISRKIHPLTKNIIENIKNKNVPIFCLGLGISEEKFESEDNYFLDHESILFWKYVYETSKIFSVRDKIAYNVLKNYGINAELTGCPALFDLESLEGKRIFLENNKKIKILVSISQINSMIKELPRFLLTLCFLYVLKRRFNKKVEMGLTFMHGYGTTPLKIVKKFASILDMKSYDISKKSLDSYTELYDYDVQIGTRLHSTIFFLSMSKPSFLFNVDMRTEAFLKTITIPSDSFTISGIRNLVIMLRDKIEADKYGDNFSDFDGVYSEITKLYIVMGNFLNKIVLFYKKLREEDL